MAYPRVNQLGTNQFEIYTDDALIFQSYNTVIAVITPTKIMLDKNKWDFSKTTGKYRNSFLGNDTKEVREDLKTGKAILINDL